MQLRNLFCLLLLGVLQPLFGQCPTLAWSDEFDGTSLDLTKWSYQLGDGCDLGICGWGNNELQAYQEENVVVSNGTLKINARKQRVRGSQYTSGRINSKGKADFTYGRFEASIKLPYGDGLWPAFWMLSTDEAYGGWPQSGEIDIMEFVASNPGQTLGYIHYGDLYPNNQSQGNTYSLNGANFPDAFHEFALEWEPGVIRWYVDDVLFSTKTEADVAPFQWPFDQDFHFLLNVAVGGNLGGPVNNNMLPATMEVDYVRVYNGFEPYLTGDRVVSNAAQGVSYSIENLANGVSVNWSVPSDATIVSGQGTSSIVVDFGSASGTLMATYDTGCGSGVSQPSFYVEVEPPYARAYSFENFDDPGTATYASSTGTLTELNNPNPDATNATNLVGKYDRNGAEQYDVLVYNVSSITNAADYVNKDKKFYADVYTSAAVGTQIILQLETSTATASNYPAGRHSRYVATVQQGNQWERLAFSLLDRPDVTASDAGVSTMILLFASNSFTANTYYFDNLDSYSAGGVPPLNQAPTVGIVTPANNATFTTGTSLTVEATASDADGSVSQVEFFVNGNPIGVDGSAPYTVNWAVASGSSTLTAVATDNSGASTSSAAVSVNGQSGGTATSVHVASIGTGTADAGRGTKFATASVNIVDNLGLAVPNATVSGTFSGTFSETATATTDAAGVASFQTVASAKGSISVGFCVNSVSAALPYQPSANTLTCLSDAGIASRSTGRVMLQAHPGLTLFPNPAHELVHIALGDEATIERLVVTTIDGRVVLRQEVRAQRTKLSVADLAPGLYIVRATDTEGGTYTARLLR